jgi:hypothetical protein
LEEINMYKPDFVKYFARRRKSRDSYIAKILGGIMFSLAISSALFMTVSAHELEQYDNDTVAYVLAMEENAGGNGSGEKLDYDPNGDDGASDDLDTDIGGENYGGGTDIEIDDELDDDEADDIEPGEDDEEEPEPEETEDKDEEPEPEDELEDIEPQGISEYQALLLSYDAAIDAFNAAEANFEALQSDFLNGGAVSADEVAAAYGEMEDAYYELYAINISLHEALGNDGADEYRGALSAHRAASASFAADLADYDAASAAHAERALTFSAELEEYRTALTSYAVELSSYAESLLEFRTAQAAFELGEISEIPAAPAVPVMPDLTRPVAPGDPPNAPEIPGIPDVLAQFAPQGITLQILSG